MHIHRQTILLKYRRVVASSKDNYQLRFYNITYVIASVNYHYFYSETFSVPVTGTRKIDHAARYLQTMLAPLSFNLQANQFSFAG
jgi:hypothetical protein